MMNRSVIRPNWPAPACINAYTTLRDSGVSSPENRLDKNKLATLLNLPNEPIWLHQVHGAAVITAIPENTGKDADASISNQPKRICAIQTADCLPILLCNKQGTEVAAIHAGWRGLSKNIIAATIKTMESPGEELLAWIGPGISQPNFEIGEEVRDIFITNDPNTTAAFIPSPNQRWLADLYAIARMQLQKLKVTAIYGGDLCTYANREKFFSYRRDGAGAGRIVSLIWINP